MFCMFWCLFYQDSLSVCVFINHEQTYIVFLLNHLSWSRFNHDLTCISVTVWLCMFPLSSSSTISVVCNVRSLHDCWIPDFLLSYWESSYSVLFWYCINFLNPVACYIWMSACLFVKMCFNLTCAACPGLLNVNVCLHNHGFPPTS